MIREMHKFNLKIFRRIFGIISAIDLKWCNRKELKVSVLNNSVKERDTRRAGVKNISV